MAGELQPEAAVQSQELTKDNSCMLIFMILQKRNETGRHE